MMNLLRTIELALKSLLLHKLRSGLTMLGIVFGVFSVIAMLAIGEGASQQAQEQVLKLGATNIIVRSVKPPRETAGSQAPVPLCCGTDYCALITICCPAQFRLWSTQFRFGN